MAVLANLAARRRGAGTQRGHRPDPGTGRREGGKLALRRAAALDDRRRIAGAGTRGKTSRTSLLVVALQGCGLDPSFANGPLVERPSQAASGDNSRRITP